MVAVHGDSGGVTRSDIEIEQDRVTSVLSSLGAARTKVSRGARLAQIPPASFGAADTATTLELHASKAHHHVVDGFDQTVAGLESYNRALTGFLDDISQRQAEQVSRFATIEQGLECVAQPTFESNSACELPSGQGA